MWALLLPIAAPSASQLHELADLIDPAPKFIEPGIMKGGNRPKYANIRYVLYIKVDGFVCQQGDYSQFQCFNLF